MVLSTNASEMVYSVDTAGGAGWLGNWQDSPLSVTNAIFTGGHAGHSVAVSTNANANAAMLFPVGDALLFQPELRLHWRHNFNTDPGRISYTTDGTGTGSSAGIQSPEEDTLVIGAGLLTTVKERINIDLRIDQQLSDGWKSTTYGGSLKIHF